MVDIRYPPQSFSTVFIEARSRAEPRTHSSARASLLASSPQCWHCRQPALLRYGCWNLDSSPHTWVARALSNGPSFFVSAFVFFETRSHVLWDGLKLAVAGLEFSILLLPPSCWDYKIISVHHCACLSLYLFVTVSCHVPLGGLERIV